MTRQRFARIDALIAHLLSRHESNPAAQAPIAAIDIDGFANMDLRDAFDEELGELARIGAISLILKGPKSDRHVTGARLKDATLLYRRVGRLPASDMASRAVSALRGRSDLPSGAIALIDDVAAAWTRGVSHLGVPVGDSGTLGQIIDLAMAIAVRLSGVLQPEQDFRTFSRLSVGDSKALERNVRQVATATKRILGDDQSWGQLDPAELLASAGLRRLPQPILLGGHLSLDGRAFPPMPYVGVPSDCAEGISLLIRPSYMLTIENFTSFVRYVREVEQPEPALVIYSGGFPSRPTLAVIRKLAQAAQCPVFHWGDMDAGGVRIFRHIELALADLNISLAPHMMSEELLRQVGQTRPQRNGAVGNMAGSAIAKLAQAIIETGLAHEQEGFSPDRPVVETKPPLSISR